MFLEPLEVVPGDPITNKNDVLKAYIRGLSWQFGGQWIFIKINIAIFNFK